jgi:hypothetical protein
MRLKPKKDEIFYGIIFIILVLLFHYISIWVSRIEISNNILRHIPLVIEVVSITPYLIFFFSKSYRTFAIGYVLPAFICAIYNLIEIGSLRSLVLPSFSEFSILFIPIITVYISFLRKNKNKFFAVFFLTFLLEFSASFIFFFVLPNFSLDIFINYYLKENRFILDISIGSLRGVFLSILAIILENKYIFGRKYE